MAGGAAKRRGLGAGDGKAVSYEDVDLAIEKRLFLARLPPAVTEDEIRKAFESFGTLTECRILTGKNVAFVGFETWAAAHRALIETDDQRQLPGHRDGQVLAVSFAEKTKIVGRGGGFQLSKGLDNSRVFVGSLPEATTDDDLRELFERFGEVLAANLLPAKHSNKRCGFVNFSIWGEALDAVENMNNKPLRQGGPEITVKMADPSRDGSFGGGRAGRPPDGAFKNTRYDIFGTAAAKREHAASPGDNAQEEAWKRRRVDGKLGTISGSARKAEFDSLFVQYRVAVDSSASTDEKCEQLHRSLMDLRGIVFGGGPDVRSRSRSRSRSGPPPRVSLRQADDMPDDEGDRDRDRQRDRERDTEQDRDRDRDRDEGNRLFVSGLPKECDDEVLRALIEQLKFRCYFKDAEILECRVLVCGGCGYVSFRSREAAEEALEQLDDRQVSGWPKALRARWAEEPNSPASPGRRGDSRDDPRRRRDRCSDGSREPSEESASRPRGGYDSWSDRERGGRGRSVRRPRSPDGRGRVSSGGGKGGRRLFVGQLRGGLTEGVVRDLFRPFGELEECRVLLDKGVAYITFADDSNALDAKEALDGKPIGGISRGEGLNVQYAKPRPERR